METTDKLNQLASKLVNPRADLKIKQEKWAIDLKRALAVRSFSEHDAVRRMRQALSRKVAEITKTLSYAPTLTEKDRDRLFDRRASYMLVLNFFTQAEVTVDKIDADVSYELGEDVE